MFRNILQTLGSRLIIGISNVVILLITTNFFGAEIKGEISLFVLSISLTTLVSGFAGGPALVFLVPRGNILPLFIINLIWSIVSILIVTLILYEFTYLSINLWVFYLVAVIESIIAICLMILLGQERILAHNILQLTKVISTLLLLFILILYKEPSLDVFVLAYAASALISLIGSIGCLRRSLLNSKRRMVLKEFMSSMTLGFTVQLGNLAQLLNYRLNYYLLEWLISPPEIALIRIGIFSTATQISESLWQFARSVNTVQYARIANMDDRASAAHVTTLLARLNTIVTAVGITILLLIPEGVYTAVIGAEFGEIKQQLYLLSPGILALAFSGALSQFFAGIGEYKFNTFTSLSTLFLTILIATPAIMKFEIVGAAAATSIIYLIQMLLLTYFFTSREGISLGAFQPKRSDMSLLSTKLKEIWKRNF